MTRTVLNDSTKKVYFSDRLRKGSACCETLSVPIEKENKQHAASLKQVGGNVEAFLALLCLMPDTAAYPKGRKGRIMFLNTGNCENGNVKKFSDAVGQTRHEKKIAVRRGTVRRASPTVAAWRTRRRASRGRNRRSCCWRATSRRRWPPHRRCRASPIWRGA